MYRDIYEVYHNVCKELIIKTQDTSYHLFITHSDYQLYIPNGCYTLCLSIETKIPKDIHLNGYDIHINHTLDLYEYFFETSMIHIFGYKHLYNVNIQQTHINYRITVSEIYTLIKGFTHYSSTHFISYGYETCSYS